MIVTKWPLLFLCVLLSQLSIAQINVEDPTASEGTVENIPEGVETRSQEEIAAAWIDKMYWSWYPETANGMMKMGVSQDIAFKKNEAGVVTEIWVGKPGVEDKYPLLTVSGSDFSSGYNKNHMMNIYITDKAIVCYTFNTSDWTVSSIDWVARSRKSYGPMKKEIQAYLDYADLKIEADRTARIKAREEHRKKYSLEGKDVVAIEVLFPKGRPETISLTGVEIGFEATLSDGTKIKTRNCGGQGYIEDYAFDFHNGAIGGVSDTYSPIGYGDYYTPNSTIQGAYTDIMGKDIFKMTVTSQYGGSGSAELILPLRYPTSLTHMSTGQDGYTYPGTGSSTGTAAGHGSPTDIWVKKVKHTETGEDLYFVKIVDGFSGSVKYLKLSMGGNLTVNVSGGRGGDGQRGNKKGSDDAGKPGKGGNGGRGGDGGDIVLTKDPNAKDFVLIYDNAGGKGGYAGRGGDCISCPFDDYGDPGIKGEDGDDGSYKEVVKAVSL